MFDTTELVDRSTSPAPKELIHPGIQTEVRPPCGRGWLAPFGLRFLVVYFVIYVATTQMLPTLLPLPVGAVPNLGTVPPVTVVVEWTAANIFGASLPLVIVRSGSGDKTFDWVHAFVVVLLALLLAAIWVWRWRTADDMRLRQWSQLFVRLALGATLVNYGAVKAIPLQMPYPSLNRLLERYGDFSPMGVLWASIGASPAYEMFSGVVELLAGILLFIPQTATLGALTALAATTQVFTLNMTYDVPVKLFSFHLVLMSLFLLAPYWRRLLHVLVLDRPAAPSSIPPLGKNPRRRRAAVVAQVLAGTYVVGMFMFNSAQSWTTFGGGAPRSPLYGIWDIEEMAIDGRVRAPLLTDYDRWRRITFDRPTAMSFHRMDDSVIGHTVRIDETAKTITLSKPQDAKWSAVFTYERVSPEQLTMSGELEGRRIEMRTRLVDRSKFLLVSRGFHWVQEYPFNR